MKKFFLILILVLLSVAVAALYWFVFDGSAYHNQPAQVMPPPAEKVATTPATEKEPAVGPAPEPAKEEISAPEPEPEPEKTIEPEPVPAPEQPELPVLTEEAETLVSKAEAGDAVAQFNLARLFVLGEGMQINRAEFMRWCRTAAEQGLPEAQFSLGMCYRQGLGVDKNEDEARSLLQLAAEAGYAPAVEALK